VDGNIKVVDDWDAVLKRSIKKDILSEVSVEIFDYDGSKVVSANSTTGEIIAYDKNHDLAAIKLNNPRKMEHVASLYPREEIENLRLFDPVWVSGCSLLHDPFSSPGTLTYLREMIEQKSYLMYNAPSIFGNSGGGLFHGTGHLLGLSSRITSIQLGFATDVMTWMGFSTHPDRMYEFIDHQELAFLYDDTDDYYNSLTRRENKRREALKAVLFEGLAPPDFMGESTTKATLFEEAVPWGTKTKED